MKRKIAAIGLLVLAWAAVAVAGVSGITRVSVASGDPGAQANAASFASSISDDGRKVAFVSDATNLVAGDTNNWSDIFLRDLVTHQTRRISVMNGGGQVDGSSSFPAMSGNGQFVAFNSESSLLPGGVPGSRDIYVQNLVTGVTERVSKSSAGVTGNALSTAAGISRDGRFVAFISNASNLVPGDTNKAADAFLRDRQTGLTERISVSSEEAQADKDSVFGPCQVSDDGNFVAFQSRAANLAPGDGNTREDVFVRNRAAGLTEIVSVSSSEQVGTLDSGRPTLSGDGRFALFFSSSDNLVTGDTNGVADAFLRDRVTGTTERISIGNGEEQGNGFSIPFAISEDGRFVAFTSVASNLVAGDTNATADAFIRDRDLGTTERVSVSAAGGQASGGVNDMTPDARFIAIGSPSPGLVSGDTNGVDDIFVSEYSVPGGNRPPNADAGPDQTVATQTTSAEVTLDASGSTDPDNDELTYTWKENGSLIATGKAPSVDLAVGTHDITLVVEDTSQAADTDGVTIKVESDPSQGDFPLEVHTLDSFRIQLTWKDPTTKERAFDVERSEDGQKTWQKQKTVKESKGQGKTLKFTDKRVTPSADGHHGITGLGGLRYFYRVRARLLRDRNPLVSQVVHCAPLLAPTSLRIENPMAVTTVSVPLAWTNTNHDGGVQVEVKTPDQQGNLQTSLRTFNGTQISRADITDLTNNTYYEFRVQSTNPCGPSSWSNSVSVFTLPGGQARGGALFRATTLSPQITQGGNAVRTSLMVGNVGVGSLEIWVNQPTPFWAPGQPESRTTAGYRLSGSPSVLRGAADFVIPQGGPDVDIGPLVMRAGANAPLGALPGQWVIYTSDSNHVVTVITIQGTVLPAPPETHPDCSEIVALANLRLRAETSPVLACPICAEAG